METRVQYGPYSPQEIDRISDWLKQNQIQFELIRNDQEAKEALMNDGQNVVSLVEFRTKVYLAQVFYVDLIDVDDVRKKIFEDQFALGEEVFPPARSQQEHDDKELIVGKLKHQIKKRTWARVLSLLYIVPIVISVYYLFFKES